MTLSTGHEPQAEAAFPADQESDLDALLNRHFAGRVVRKDLTQRVKEGANVPVYVLEYLLGMYCASDDAEVIAQGLDNVKQILADNYVRPDEAEKIKSLVRERGSYKVIDRVTVRLNEKRIATRRPSATWVSRTLRFPRASSSSTKSCWSAASG